MRPLIDLSKKEEAYYSSQGIVLKNMADKCCRWCSLEFASRSTKQRHEKVHHAAEVAAANFLSRGKCSNQSRATGTSDLIMCDVCSIFTGNTEKQRHAHQRSSLHILKVRMEAAERSALKSNEPSNAALPSKEKGNRFRWQQKENLTNVQYSTVHDCRTKKSFRSIHE
jgi:23S rRNA C2498 (ribose-2'-O)-methylase RlmM